MTVSKMSGYVQYQVEYQLENYATFRLRCVEIYSFL
jgi:hypothetical protein